MIQKKMTEGLQNETTHPGFAEALQFWWKLGWISFGGTAAHIAIMHEGSDPNRRFSGPELVPTISRIKVLQF
jgi:hypothetical protein